MGVYDRDAFYIGTIGGQVVRLHAGSGTIEWTYPVGDSIASSPVVAEDTVYVFDVTGKLHTIDRNTGTGEWSQTVAGPISYSPGITRNALYVLSDSGLLSVIDRETRSLELELEVGGAAVAAFAVDGGTIYHTDGSTTVVARSSADGSELFRNNGATALRAGPVVAEDYIVLAYADGTIALVDRVTGDIVRETAGPSGISPGGLAMADDLFVTTVDGAVHAYSLPDLTAIWRHEGPSGYPGPVSVAGGLVYALSGMGELYCIDATDGVELYRFDTGVRTSAPATPIDAGVLVVGETGSVQLLVPGGGETPQPVDESESGGITQIELGTALTRPVPQDRDLLIFAPERTGTYEIRLPSQGDVEMIVDVFDSQGAQVASNLDKVSLDSTFAYRFQGDQEYLFQVQPVREGLAGQTYTMEVHLLRDE
jgi:outer membrane protein assembly factor BamB